MNRDLKDRLGRESRNPSHAYLFVGDKGQALYLATYYFASLLLGVEAKDSPDYHEVRALKKSIGVAVIRDIGKELNKTSYNAPNKVYNILDGDVLTREAQNALLKSLEEPPPNTIILVSTSSLLDILPTVRSRLLLIRVAPLRDDEIIKSIREKGYNGDLKPILAYGQGQLDRALAYIEDPKIKENRDKCFEAVKELFEGNKSWVVRTSKFFEEEQDRAHEIAHTIISILRDVWAYRVGGSDFIQNIDKVDEIVALSEKGEIFDLDYYERALNKFLMSQEYNCNYGLAIDAMLLSIRGRAQSMQNI